jgi:hypothetical protein
VTVYTGTSSSLEKKEYLFYSGTFGTKIKKVKIKLNEKKLVQ